MIITKIVGFSVFGVFVLSNLLLLFSPADGLPAQASLAIHVLRWDIGIAIYTMPLAFVADIVAGILRGRKGYRP